MPRSVADRASDQRCYTIDMAVFVLVALGVAGIGFVLIAERKLR